MSTTTEPIPIPKPAAFRVENRSDRVFVFGYARMAPFLLWIGTIAIYVIFGNYLGIASVFGIMGLLISLVALLILDRSAIFDPVDHVMFSDRLIVKRLAKLTTFALDRVRQVEFKSSDGSDYDDRNRGRAFCEITLRIRRAWPARLLTTQQHAVSIANWAKANGKAIVEFDRTALPQ